MRIKNEAEFVRLAIESHLPFYDEIVAVYNDCTDNTEAILLELQAQHPEKIKVFHYLPKVFAALTPEQAASVGRDDDVHALANYYNWTLAKCTYGFATKLDADHVAIPHALGTAIAEIRRRFAAGEDKRFLFSGLNVVYDETGKLAMKNWPEVGKPYWLSGDSEIFYHPIDARSFFINDTLWERPNPKMLWVHQQYAGLLYIHVKFLKAESPRYETLPFDKFVTRLLGEYKDKQRTQPLRDRIGEMRMRLKGRNKRLIPLPNGYFSLQNARIYNLKTEIRQIVRSGVLRTIEDWEEPTRTPIRTLATECEANGAS